MRGRRGIVALAAFLLLALVGLVARPKALAPPPSAAPLVLPPDDEPMATSAPAVASYTLTASLDTSAHTVKGGGTITWRNASSVPVRELWLHLYMNAFKNERSVFMRFAGTDGFRGVGAPAEWGSISIERLALGGVDLWPGADKTSPGEPDDETDARVPLPAPVAPGDTIELEVAFTTRLPSLVFRTGHADGFHMVAQWFPKVARLEPDGTWAHFSFHHLSEFYADFGAYDVTVDAPADVVVGATGALASETRAGGRALRRYVQANVHDFAFTAWSKFRELRGEHEGVAIRVLYPPGYDDAAAVELASARFGLERFGRLYGRYPYGTLTLVHPPGGAEEAGGMEYPTLITTGGEWFLPKTGVHLVEGVTIHELGHQWFYGLCASNEHDFPFLDEGMNSYAELDAMEARWPDRSGAALFGLSVSEGAFSRVGAVESARNAPVAQPAPAFATGRDYSNLVYRRTAVIFATLANVYGADLVRAAVGRYTRRYRFKHPRPEDLLDTVREVMGPEVGAQVWAALFDRASVDYRVADLGSTLDAKTGTHKGSVLVRRLGELRFPVDVEMVGQDGTHERVRWDARETSARLSYEGPSELVAAVVDPDHLILLDEDLSNNALRVAPSRVSGVLLDRLSFVVEAALAGVLP